MEPFRFHYDLRVRWSEVDAQLIVFNANYMMYLDLAFQEYWRRGLKLSSGMPSTVLAKSTIQFRQSAEFDDELQIWVRTKSIGNTSMILEFAITRDGVLLFEAESVYVYIDQEAKRPCPVPADWREKINVYEAGASEER